MSALSSGDVNDTHNDKDKDKYTDKYKVLQRPNICYIFEEQGVLGEDFRTVDMVGMNMADMDDLDMVDMDMVDMDKQGLRPRGSSVDSILSFFPES